MHCLRPLSNGLAALAQEVSHVSPWHFCRGVPAHGPFSGGLPMSARVLQWATFPLLLLAFQAGDIQALLDNRTVGATLHGADRFEKARVPTLRCARVCLGTQRDAATPACSVRMPLEAGRD